jgi:2'-5' RNA ligase
MLLEGVYGSYKLTQDSANKLAEWMKENEVVEPVEIDNIHITTTYSKTDPIQDIIPSQNTIILDHKEFSIATYGRALVIEVESKELEDIHNTAIKAGATYEYDEYKPHITISYNAEANENLIPLLFPPTFDIVLSHEEIEPLKEDDVISDSIPANSVTNIAIYDRPLGAPLRRRIKSFKNFTKQSIKLR